MLTLAETKQHLRVDLEDDNSLIASLMTAATTATANYLDNAAIVMDATAPAPVKTAALLLVADLYENRTAQTERPLFANTAYERLLAPYRTLTA